jgi:hypothetical protein
VWQSSQLAHSIALQVTDEQSAHQQVSAILSQLQQQKKTRKMQREKTLTNAIKNREVSSSRI